MICGDKMYEQFECSSVIPGHHIYEDILCPPMERHSRAEDNSIVTMSFAVMAIIENDTIMHWTSLH